MAVDLLESGPHIIVTSPNGLRQSLEQAMGPAMQSSLAAHNAFATSRYVDHMLRAMTSLLPAEIGGHRINYNSLLSHSTPVPPSSVPVDTDGSAHEYVAYKPSSSVDVSSLPRLATKLSPYQEPMTLNWSPYEEQHPDKLPHDHADSFDAYHSHIDFGKANRIRREIMRRRYFPFDRIPKAALGSCAAEMTLLFQQGLERNGKRNSLENFMFASGSL
ncbi:hypothetical protein FOL47_010132 [Perkinsus chesapeaki]|uniref:Uncharacterized protein n=1 Tax=Perkinsus chesapeaki TaxID=330153 RepID=A0A7J6MQ99_PERCH|nr:hypothetical protein FOL47_010132 [Perkinsus chesapeaki]